MPRRPANQHPSYPDYPHGSTTGYRYGCRKDYPCPATPTCTQEGSRYARERVERLRNGQPPRTLYQPKPLAGHLKALRKGGWKNATMARVCGVSRTTMARVIAGQCTVSLAVAKRLLALDEKTLIEKAPSHLPARLVYWRLRSLYAMGYTCNRMARRTGMGLRAVRRFVREGRTVRYVNRATYEAVVAMFAEWSPALEPTGYSADVARADARRRGYLTPDLYTDDGLLIDEEAVPTWLRRRHGRRLVEAA